MPNGSGTTYNQAARKFTVPAQFDGDHLVDAESDEVERLIGYVFVLGHDESCLPRYCGLH